MKPLVAAPCVGLAVLFAVAALAPSAAAAPRTFVSGTGADAGACTRAAPCLTFAFAHDQTDAGGEITCIDAGDFAALTITKSITIDCGGTLGGIRPLAFAAIAVNAPDVVVRLRNLSLKGGGGSVGVQFMNGAALFVENCVITNFTAGPSGEGIGIRFAPPSGVSAELYVIDSVISGNGRPNDGGGIVIIPVGAARVSIERTRLERNTYGLFANSRNIAGAGDFISVQMRDSAVAGSKFDGVTAFTNVPAGRVSSITMDRSSSLLNGRHGVLAQGGGAFVTLAGATVSGNGFGLTTDSGGQIVTYGNNQASGNAAGDPTPADPTPAGHSPASPPNPLR